MKKPLFAFVFATILFVTLVVPVLASISVKSTIGDTVFVVINLGNLDQDVYNEAFANTEFNGSTIPQIIVNNLARQNLTHVFTSPQPIVYDNTTRTIRVSFSLGGSEIISYEVNRTSMKRTYHVNTEWRKFQVFLTGSFSLDFDEYFADPVEGWQKINGTTYHFELHKTGFFDVLSFDFTLPSTATNIQARGDTITYEAGPYFEDVFFGSPFLVLAALLVVVAVVLVYRRIR